MQARRANVDMLGFSEAFRDEEREMGARERQWTSHEGCDMLMLGESRGRTVGISNDCSCVEIFLALN